jgi:hypothetical protein
MRSGPWGQAPTALTALGQPTWNISIKVLFLAAYISS